MEEDPDFAGLTRFFYVKWCYMSQAHRYCDVFVRVLVGERARCGREGSLSGDASDRQLPFPSRQYVDERDLPVVMHLIDNELSEPYSIFTYRFFLKKWPKLCFMAMDGDHCFGEIRVA